MYVLAIGINEFKNPKLKLEYAVADAKLFAEVLKESAKELFEKIEVKLLTTKEETTKESIVKALEGYEGHGLFTYVLAEGLRGKADKDRDGVIRTVELSDYVDLRVPELAEKVFKRAQYPTAMPSGQAFPIGEAK